MKTIATLFVIMATISGCDAQQRSEQNKQSGKQSNVTEIKPKASWKVNKRLDKDGNIISYDSTYTWTYSNIDGQDVSIEADSVMAQFRTFFDNQFPYDWDDDLGRPFWTDTVIRPGFFRDDYFHNLWRNDLYHMDEMFKRMDSMRMHFFDRAYPGLIKPPTQKREDHRDTDL